MTHFFSRHPFYKNLVKFAAYIVVGYNTLAFCMLAPFIVLVVAAVALGGSSANSPTTFSTIYGVGASQLLSIKVNGVIMGDKDEVGGSVLGSLSGQVSGYDVKSKLYAAAVNPTIKGVVLEINSPGGTIYGAHAIADGVKYFQDKTHQPVYAFISGLGASGAYWAAVSADKVLVDYGSDVGSVGVIMGPFEYYDKVVAEDGGLLGSGVVTQNGIEHFNITAGKSKDVGSPYRRLTADELAMLQKQVNNDYDLFVQYVSDRRGIPSDTLRNQIGAMAYDNKTAQQLKLIDGTANREDAYAELAKAAKISDNDYSVVREDAPSGFIASLLGALSGKPRTQAASSAANASVSAASTCAITKSTLAYYGDVIDLCP